MTKLEREKPTVINPSRKRRIAAGSGTRVEDVNRLLRQFEQMQKCEAAGRKVRQRQKTPPLPLAACPFNCGFPLG